MRSKILATLAGASLAGGAVLALAPSASASEQDCRLGGLRTVTSLTVAPASPQKVANETDKADATVTITTIPRDVTDKTVLTGTWTLAIDNQTGIIQVGDNSFAVKLAVGDHHLVGAFTPDSDSKCYKGSETDEPVLDRVIVVQETPVPGPTVTNTATVTDTVTNTVKETVSGGSSGPGFTG